MTSLLKNHFLCAIESVVTKTSGFTLASGRYFIYGTWLSHSISLVAKRATRAVLCWWEFLGLIFTNSMLVLFETPAGYALFKVRNFTGRSWALWEICIESGACGCVELSRVYLRLIMIMWNYSQLLDEKKLQKTDNLYKEFETPDGASKVWVCAPNSCLVATFLVVEQWSRYLQRKI